MTLFENLYNANSSLYLPNCNTALWDIPAFSFRYFCSSTEPRTTWSYFYTLYVFLPSKWVPLSSDASAFLILWPMSCMWNGLNFPPVINYSNDPDSFLPHFSYKGPIFNLLNWAQYILDKEDCWEPMFDRH